MRFAPLLAVARSEAQLTLRLVRFWIFVALSALVGLGTYLFYALIHRTLSAQSATVAGLGPRYLVALFGSLYVLVFLLGLVFLGIDVRARDVRQRIVEVLESRPLSNLELVGGRFLGVLIPSWTSVLVITAGLFFLGALIGEAIEPLSLLVFVGLMALPAFAFTLGLVIFLSLLVRNRLVAALLAVACLVLLFYGAQKVPIYLAPAVNLTGGFALGYPSDLIRWTTEPAACLQRLAVLLTGLGLVVLAAVLHPRPDDGSRLRRALGGAAILAAAAALVLVQIADGAGDLRQIRQWRQIHGQHAAEPAPDLETVTGVLRIDPGRVLAADLELTFRLPRAAAGKALFSLNPGFEVEGLTGADGQPLDFNWQDGLLEIDLPPQSASQEPGSQQPAEHTVRLRLRGMPDGRFAYLDSYLTLLALPSDEAELYLLGSEPLIFRSGYVALLPGLRWLPAAGAEIGRDDPELRPADFFRLDLEVELPAGWLVAGPGRRREVPASGPDTGSGVRYRFSPPVPIPEAALVAGRFARRAATVAGVEMEVLLHPSHTANLELLEDAAGEIRRWIGERLGEAAELGLPYPYEGLSLVEIPNLLRSYGGGWRMDTALAPPGMLLVRESSFPTARFDVAFADLGDAAGGEGGRPAAQRRQLEGFFRTDFNGGNLLTGASRSFFLHQTRARGPGGIALDYLFENLTSLLVTGSRGYFSAHVFSGELNQMTIEVMTTWATLPRGQDAWDDVVFRTLASRPQVWETALEVSLAELDPRADPRRALDVLALKGGILARSLLDSLGREQVGRLLAVLLERHRGGLLDAADVVAAGREVGPALGNELDALLANGLDATALPGFSVVSAELYRLPDDGAPRYQTLVTLANGEPVPGLVRLEYETGPRRDAVRGRSEPVRVAGGEAVEIGLITSRPPRRLWVEPYLSLNRLRFAVTLPPLDEERIRDEEPRAGAKTVEWEEASGTALVVDDLDPGFTVEDSAGRGDWRLGGQSATLGTDQGLPLFRLGLPPKQWARLTTDRAWGRYRRTLALVRAGDGDQRAVFSARLPRSGPWRLELYVPPAGALPLPMDRGTWNLTVAGPSGRQDVTFDAGAADAGWNRVGTFEVAAGEVRLGISDRTGGQVVLADAVRWLPPEETSP